ncbi:hypothetical protein SZN_04206 [Streptomyces zinciresistens K42]|uniref:HMA domain-containing protein n=1 Tax=Streptomyces zinciresistens K42 TaxID=700597 RepID=G2G5T7_9ACTN|nr:heavy metal-associated domain-containing protein [Streptomyces zinciresistens]EGX61026.1 hypothetical protein SZN_04206 [Streptomyces zinciresistens K42]
MLKALIRACGQCQVAIEGVVAALPGVTIADVSSRARAVAVRYDAPAEPSGIEAAIRGAGYRIGPYRNPSTEGSTS